MSDLENYTIDRGNVSAAYLQEYRKVYTERKYYNPVLYKNASRYTNIRTLKDDDGTLYDENWIQKFVDKSADDQYMTVSLREENRLDIISNDYYNTPNYWWVIALGNYIIDPFTIPVGTYLRIPQISSLYNQGEVLNNG